MFENPDLMVITGCVGVFFVDIKQFWGLALKLVKMHLWIFIEISPLCVP